VGDVMKHKLSGLLAVLGLFASALFTPAMAQTARPWMSGEVAQAWQQGFRGQGTSITVIDDFKGYTFSGKLTGKVQVKTHGAWTQQQAQMIAPSARVLQKDYNRENQAVQLQRGLNILNLSYGMMGAARRNFNNWAPQEASIIRHAQRGAAVVSKAAGNEATAVGQIDSSGQMDFLNVALIGTPSTIFVGALTQNGSVSRPSSLASYSNFAGTDGRVQRQFLVVGVNQRQMGLSGTSFAAPIISGYAAILGSKFRTATPTQVANQLLSTARKDTILNYDIAVHGQGEASIARALAPRALR
jgi:hypothetical protein